MKIDEFEIMITNSIDKDGLSAEIRQDTFELGAVFMENGKPIIEIGPNRRNELGVWKIDYQTFKNIIKSVDDFLASIGYSTET